jgi:hypothetical protein
MTVDDPSSGLAHDFVMLTPDYDPWPGYEWPDRSGQIERAPRKPTSG